MGDCPTCGLPRCPCDVASGRDVLLLAKENARLQSAAEERGREVERLRGELVEARALAERSVRRLVEATAPGSIGAFAARDTAVARLAKAHVALDLAWGLVANAGGGNWDRESLEWKEAAERWRDEFWGEITADVAKRAAAQPEEESR